MPESVENKGIEGINCINIKNEVFVQIIKKNDNIAHKSDGEQKEKEEKRQFCTSLINDPDNRKVEFI